jgi:hypothetical protein
VNADGATFANSSIAASRVQEAPDLEVRPAAREFGATRCLIPSRAQLRLTPAPYPHWTLRECFEQPEAIARALGFGGRLSEERIFLGGLDRNSDRMARIKHMMLTGCGTSMNASMFGAKVTRPHLLSRVSRARSRARLTRESALLRQLMRELGSFETAVAMDSAEARAIAARFRHACI